MTMTVVADKEQDLVQPEQVVELLRRALVSLQPGPEVLAEEWPNLTIQQLRVMRILYSEGPTRVSVLARRLEVSTPTVTGILDRLVRQGLTYRADDPRDRRVVLNALTAAGEAAMRSLYPVQEARLMEAVARLTDEDRKSLVAGLSSLLAGAAA